MEQDDGDDLFVHKSQVSGRGLREGDIVEFEIGDSDKGPNAINVSKMDEEE
ncbi:MAG: cold-shock protein [Euryarchaeota archaeon]|nr:cold-shock protein [Euryarchaeota archaeon]